MRDLPDPVDAAVLGAVAQADGAGVRPAELLLALGALGYGSAAATQHVLRSPFLHRVARGRYVRRR